MKEIIFEIKKRFELALETKTGWELALEAKTGWVKMRLKNSVTI